MVCRLSRTQQNLRLARKGYCPPSANATPSVCERRETGKEMDMMMTNAKEINNNTYIRINSNNPKPTHSL